MKPRMLRILEACRRFNSANMVWEAFRLDPGTVYDALVVAPAWKPTAIVRDPQACVTVTREGAYISGYEVERDGLKIAWIQTASGAGNLIDHLTIASELTFRKLIFIGAVGSLSEKHDIGALCTPEYSIDGSFSCAWLCDRLTDYTPFGRMLPDAPFIDRVAGLARRAGVALRRAPVFCTDSIALEYAHLDEIRATGAELIEMETAAFYRMAELIEVPAAALLVVSDNSATGKPLVGMGEAQRELYHRQRNDVIPDLIFRIAAME